MTVINQFFIPETNSKITLGNTCSHLLQNSPTYKVNATGYVTEPSEYKLPQLSQADSVKAASDFTMQMVNNQRSR